MKHSLLFFTQLTSSSPINHSFTHSTNKNLNNGCCSVAGDKLFLNLMWMTILKVAIANIPREMNGRRWNPCHFVLKTYTSSCTLLGLWCLEINAKKTRAKRKHHQQKSNAVSHYICFLTSGHLIQLFSLSWTLIIIYSACLGR